MSNEAPTDALRLVPVEPTEKMLDAVKPWPEHWPPYGQATVSARAAYDIDRAVLRSNWAVMLAAAPTSPLPGGGCLGAEHLSAAITRLTHLAAGDEIEAAYADFTSPGHTFRADIRALLSALPAAPTGEPK